MKEYFYSIYGVGLKLTTDSSTISSAAQAFIGSFKQEALNSSIALEAFFKKVDNRTEIPIVNTSYAQVIFQSKETVGFPLNSSWRYNFYREGEIILADFFDLGLLEIKYKKRCIKGYFVECNAINPNASINFLKFALIELFKLEKLYIIHAAALEKAGRGLLIPGYSGQGKTTCCISLIRAGYRCLSDDNPFLHEGKNGLKILPFLTKIDVTERTIEFFPELRDSKECLYQGVEKRYFYIEDLYPHSQADTCEPNIIIFPQIVDSPKSHLELLPKNRAFEELLPHAILILDKSIAKQQFQTLSHLINKVDCYRLYLGRDVLELPQIIDSLLGAENKE